MIESAAYEIIKKEGFEEGLKKGLKEGLEEGLQKGFQEGLQKGLQQGLLEEAREMVIEALEERFGILPPSLISKIKTIQQREILKSLHRAAIRAKTLEEFKALLKQLDE